jgi:hypothetical protein
LSRSAARRMSFCVNVMVGKGAQVEGRSRI